MSEVKVSHPSEVVQSGDRVQVRILRIDSASHRLGLSMRLMREEQGEHAAGPRVAAEGSAGEESRGEDGAQAAEGGGRPPLVY